MRSLLLLIACTLFHSNALYSQMGAAPRVHVSNDDPGWGDVVVVDYVAPDTSRFARTSFEDTLYMAAIVSGAWREETIVMPMKRNKGTAAYQTAFQVPDSAYSIRIEICVPSDRAPDGITIFTTHMPDGSYPPGSLISQSENVDSALKDERKRYPSHYEVYATAALNSFNMAQSEGKSMSADERRAMIHRYLREMDDSPANTISFHLTKSRLHAMLKDGEEEALRDAEKAAKVKNDEEILHQNTFWYMYFAPMMKDGKFSLPTNKGVALLPLVKRFPKSEFAKVWLQRIAGDSTLSPSDVESICSAWKESNDVDLCSSLAYAYSEPTSALYNSATALRWVNRAELSWKTYSGFLNGENIFGSMGRISRIIPIKIKILNQLHREKEALDVGRGALQTIKEVADKSRIMLEMTKSHLQLNDAAAAEQTLAGALAISSNRKFSEIDSLYERRKEHGENREAYVLRIVNAFGKNVEMPRIENFSFTTINGEKAQLSDYKGKVVVIDYWFVGCAGCLIEKKSLERFAEKRKSDTNVVILSLALNTASVLENYFKPTLPAMKIVPSAQEICDKAGVSGFPTHVIIDRKGNTRTWELGGSENSGEVLDARVTEILAEK